MTARRDPDRLIKEYLEDGLTELPDRFYDAVRSEIDHTRQRIVVGPWRLPNTLTFARYGMAAAAIVLIAVLGISIWPRLGIVGVPGASPTASPLPATTATALPKRGDLGPGAYLIDDQSTTQVRRFSFTVPAGWSTDNDYGWYIFTEDNGSRGAELSVWNVDRVYGDVCQWRETLTNAGTSVDALVTALAAQAGRTASTPSDVTVGGFPGKRIEVTTPDRDGAFCQGGAIHYWPAPGPNEDITGLFANGGHIDVVYVVDVAGNRLVIVARRYPDSSPQDVAELDGVVASIRIEP